MCAVTAAMADGTGLTPFAKEFPERFFDVAIAEGHAVAMSAGLAKQGMIPVFAVYASFLQRGYDQLIHDVALQGLHVVLGVDRAGLVGADGETHHGCFDALFLSEIPGFTVLCPASFAELRRMLRRAPVRDRRACGGPLSPGRGGGTTGRTGPTALWRSCGPAPTRTILTYGILVNQALAAADLLEQHGVSARVVKLNQIAPLDFDLLAPALAGTDTLVVAEDASAPGAWPAGGGHPGGGRRGGQAFDPEKSRKDVPAGGNGAAAAAPGRHRRRGHRPGGIGGGDMSGKKRLDVLLVERGAPGEPAEGPGRHHERRRVRGRPAGRQARHRRGGGRGDHRPGCAALCEPGRTEAGEGHGILSHRSARRRLRRHRRLHRRLYRLHAAKRRGEGLRRGRGLRPSWPGSSAQTREWSAWSGPTPGISHTNRCPTNWTSPPWT